jgi:DNA-binding NarL/FixJ family response regulator
MQWAHEDQGMTGQGAIALVADDHELFAAALAAILKRDLGFAEAIATGTFDEAFAALSANPTTAFATFDLDMPGMDDPGRLASVREAFPALRIAVVSGSARREDILRALASGAHGYVPKLLGIGELTVALRAVVSGAMFVPPVLAETARGADSQAAGSAPALLPGGLVLPPRQREVLHLLAEGRSNKEIARRLKLAEGTVKVHLAGLFRRLGVRNRAAAVAAASRVFRIGACASNRQFD